MKNNSVAIYLLVKLLKIMRRSPTNSDGQRLREALTELGPVYIKLGQLLSTRSDIFGANVVHMHLLYMIHIAYDTYDSHDGSIKSGPFLNV